MNKIISNKEAVKTILASIKIAYQIDPKNPKLWRSLVYNPKFWEETSKQLEKITDWSEQDDVVLVEIVTRFKSETANLPLEAQIKKLADLLLGGWKNAKAHASLQQELEKLTDRINNKSAKS